MICANLRRAGLHFTRIRNSMKYLSPVYLYEPPKLTASTCLRQLVSLGYHGSSLVENKALTRSQAVSLWTICC